MLKRKFKTSFKIHRRFVENQRPQDNPHKCTWCDYFIIVDSILHLPISYNILVDIYVLSRLKLFTCTVWLNSCCLNLIASIIQFTLCVM